MILSEAGGSRCMNAKTDHSYRLCMNFPGNSERKEFRKNRIFMQ